MLFIVPILMFVILCLCLPQIMLQTLIGFFGYIICKALNNNNLAKMVIIITIFACLNVIMEKAMPIIEEVQGKQEYVGDKIDKYEKYKDYYYPEHDKEDIQKPIDRKIDEYTPNNWFIRMLTEYPRTR